MNLFSDRKYVISAIFISLILIYLIRLFYIQVIDKKFKLAANDNALRHKIEYPERGIIYDRQGKIMVYNEPAYDLMVIPKRVKTIDTSDFCQMLEITKEEFIEKITKLKKQKFSSFKPEIFINDISLETSLPLQEKLIKFPGFFLQARTLRKYPLKIASHALGYVGEVDDKIIAQNPYYRSGDNMGLSGIEKSYEESLRGQRGVKIVMVDVYNRERGSFDGGKYDTASVLGKSLYSSIDAGLQEYGEKLMQNKVGAIVAIEPASGEVLCMVSSPTYDPNLLVGRAKSKQYRRMLLDTLKPLFNRATMAKYPPGSTFKLVNALIGQHEGVINENTLFSCSRGFHFGGLTVGCHPHASPVNLRYSITTSCNSYYCNTFRNTLLKYKKTSEGFTVWRNHVLSFGLGKKIPIDLPQESSGNVPTVKYYDRYHGAGRWNAISIISLAIGQGEMGVTPLQMANFCTIIANRGWYYPPHLIKRIDGGHLDTTYLKRRFTTVDRKYFEVVVESMRNVVTNGTGRIAQLDSLSICAKTGTAENPHGKDHSIFIAFAPMNNPKIAIAVYVENAGFGATWAAPIASLMIEKYLRKEVKRPEMEKRILDANLLPKKSDWVTKK
ncbi:MAG: penicillin-binding protein 2 [Bacteroidia bacterium]|nr:penicillin-binding protein 2 [Bacteroidia bacterium]MCC6768494.1 penicillin-binding protein 2 [Bacteroidia bacterium]